MISDHHRGLMNAIDATMLGATWQRCRVHFMRNVLAKVSKGNTDMVAAASRTIFAQPTNVLVREQVETIAVMVEATLPAVAAMLRAAREEITAFADFPELHWRKIWSTNPIVIWSWLEDWGCDLRLCVVDGVRDVGVQHVLVTGEIRCLGVSRWGSWELVLRRAPRASASARRRRWLSVSNCLTRSAARSRRHWSEVSEARWRSGTRRWLVERCCCRSRSISDRRSGWV